jgi:sporulation protein YlmC with PRC-barrel domain
LFASDVEKMVVYTNDMQKAGKVKDLEFDVSEMKVTNIIVEFEKDAAKQLLGKKLVVRHATGKIPSSAVESIKDAINLKGTWQDLKGKFEAV